MQKKRSFLIRLMKNSLIYGGLFMAMSIAMDWYRKPASPVQFAQTVFYDVNQQPQIIGQLSAGQPMLLYFWGSWCGYCTYTSPTIEQFHQNGTPVLSVALSSGDDETIKRYLAENGYTFATINDQNNQLSKQWNIQATPTILIIKDGEIRHHTTGLTSSWGLKIRMWLSEFRN